MSIEDYKSVGFKTKSKRFKRYYRAGLLKNVDVDYVKDVIDYWKIHYGKKIDPSLHVAYYNLTGKKEKRLVPGKLMWNDFLPFLNDMNIRIGYSDKNLYDKLIPAKNIPETVLKCVRGNLLDKYNRPIELDKANKILMETEQDLIVKPSDGDNGQGVKKLYYKKGMFYLDNKSIGVKQLVQQYKNNFIIQKVIKQHPVMEAPHPSSVNTLRMVTLRWNNEIKHVLTFARFGGGNKVVDHTTSGGISVGVKDNGELMNFGLDMYNNVHTHHPTTNFDFRDNIQVPNYKNIKKFVVDLHHEVLHHDLVSWDIAVGEYGKPIFIECNYRGPTDRYQLATLTPIFGDLTEEIVQHVKMNKDSLNRDVTMQIPIQLRREIRKNNRKLKSQEKEIGKLKLKINNLQNNSKTKRQSLLNKFVKSIFKR